MRSFWSSAPRISECLDRPSDNFLLLRFLAASLVAFSHSYDTLGPEGDFLMRMPGNVGFNFGITAVCMFFFVSGFLVSGSYIRRRNLVTFVRSRALRIIPAYVVCIVLTALVVGTLCTTLSASEYLQDPATRDYVVTNLAFNRLQWGLPGVFSDNPHPDNVNASLWTLPGEVRMYLYVTVLGAIGLLSRRSIANIALIALFALGAAAPAWLPLLDYPEHFLPLAALFAAGTFCYVNRDSIPVCGALLVTLVAFTCIAHGSIAYKPLALVSIAYFCLWFAYCTRWYGFNRFGDYSYAIYLWNWPIQQALVHFLRPSGPLLMFVVSYPLILLISAASWHWIEKPALHLKAGERRQTKSPTNAAALALGEQATSTTQGQLP
jgi:peptidoglycan/LPS O-acetylase OafA/YrhL